MSAGQSLIEFKPAAARDDILLMIQIVGQDLFQRQDPRMTVDESQHDDAERFLELGMLVQLIQDDIRVNIGAELDDDAHPFAVRFIAKSRNSVDLLIAGQVGNGFNDPGLIDLVRNFCNDDTILTLIHRFDGSAGTHLDTAAARRISFDDAVTTHDFSPGREIRAFDLGHDFFQTGIRVVDKLNTTIDDFT